MKLIIIKTLIVLFSVILLFVFMNTYFKRITLNYKSSKLLKLKIDREINYLQYSIIHGNSPFNNYTIANDFTLLSIERFKNVRYIMEKIINNNIDGDILEAGNWRGGSMLFAKGIMEAYGVNNKQIFMFDTFCGFPKDTRRNTPNENKLVNGWFSDLMRSNSIENVKRTFKFYNLSNGVNFIPGLFQNTIPQTSIPRLSYLRLDADSYENTKFLLENLYDKLNVNGYIEFDDYGSMFDGCRKAVDEYRIKNNIISNITIVYEHPEKDKYYEAIYWVKT